MRHLDQYNIGPYTYTKGCRCDRCREEATAKRRAYRITFGFWGGVSERQRRGMRRVSA